MSLRTGGAGLWSYPATALRAGSAVSGEPGPNAVPMVEVVARETGEGLPLPPGHEADGADALRLSLGLREGLHPPLRDGLLWDGLVQQEEQIVI